MYYGFEYEWAFQSAQCFQVNGLFFFAINIMVLLIWCFILAIFSIVKLFLEWVCVDGGAWYFYFIHIFSHTATARKPPCYKLSHPTIVALQSAVIQYFLITNMLNNRKLLKKNQEFYFNLVWNPCFIFRFKSISKYCWVSCFFCSYLKYQ